LMRNLERDFTKLKEDFKELESQSFKRDLLDKTKPLRKAEKEELTSEVLEQVQKENLKLYLNDTSGNLTKFLNAKKPFKITMRGANIKHILNRHGENSTLAKNGQPFVNLEDIKKYDEIINNADRQILKENDKGEKTLLSGKQINGHYIVISSVRLKNGELKLKTMYKENGKLENDKAFKSVKLPSETPSVLRGQSLTTDLDGYPSHADESIAQNAKSERAEFESFKDKIKELYTKYEGLNHYDKSESQLKSKLLNEEIEPEIKKEFKNIIDKFKGADNKDKMLRVIKENKEELSDYLAFHIALRKDIYIDGYGEGRYDFYDKSIRGLFKFRENKPGSEIYDDSNYRTLAALENLSNKNTSLYFSFRDLNGKVGEFKTYPRIQDLLFYDLPLGYDLKNAVILSTKDKHLKEKLIEKLKAYIDKKIYADFLEYKIKDLESRNPKNSYFENYKDEKWDEEALKSFKKELEDLRANEKAQKLEAKGSEDIIFTDKKGKEHTLTKETQKAWLEAFGLKSLEDSYIPNHNEAIKQALEGKEIKLQLGSLKKLVAQGREKYIPQIKEVLDRPEAIMRDDMGEYLFIKHLKDDDYFVNVSFDNGEYLVSISNGIKETRNLNNKLKKGGEFIYQSPNFNFISQKLLQTSQYSANKIDEDIIAQNAKSESEKEVLERQIPLIEAEIQKYEAKIASLDERIKKTQTRIQPYLDEINALQKQYDELYFTETRGEEANAKKWLKLEEIKAKQEELRKPYNDALFKFVFPHQRLKGKVQTEIQKLKFGLQDRALRLEEIQNEALNTSKAQKAWLEAFNLKSLDEEFIPNLPRELKEALGKEIKLTKGSLYKIVEKGREKYIPQIKETFKEPEAVFIDENDDLIFTKTFNDKLFFVNVNRDYGEAFKALSLAPKKNNNLLNKLNKAKEILKLDSKLRDYTAQQAFTGVLSASNKSSGEIIPQIPKDNSQLNVLHTKIQQVRQQIAESRNPDKEYLHQVFKPDEIIELEKQYFNQAMPQEYKELIQDFPQLYEQRLANELKAYVKDTDVIQEVSAQLLNDFKDKSFKDTAKHAKLLLFNTLRDKAQELGFKELDINEPSFKVAFGKFQAKLKKGDIQDLSEHIAINSLQHDRLRIQEAL
ncbi:PBECR2 nuclease fold domain-containing protein, partial [Campylobacter upsaliensis]